MRIHSLLGLLAVSTIIASPAHAAIGFDPLDTRQKTVITVADRAQPDYDPQGFNRGSFRILPSLTLAPQYTDNVYAADTGEVDDLITVVSPEVKMMSISPQRSLAIGLRLDSGFYADNSDENYNDIQMTLGGDFEINQSHSIAVRGYTGWLHEQRSSESNVATQEEPTEFWLSEAAARWRYTPGRITFDLSGGATYYDYSNGSTAGGARIVQDDRNRTRLEAGTRLSYHVGGDWDVFAAASYNDVSYDKREFNTVSGLYNGNNRDSDGYETLAGFRLNRQDVIGLELAGGYLRQDFQHSGFDTISAGSYQFKLDWNITQLTSLSASVRRHVNETTTATDGGFLATTSRLNLDHELRRNILLGAYAMNEERDYETRDDSILGAGLYIIYKMNPAWKLRASYDYDERDSDLAGNDYERNRVMFGLGYHF